MKNVVCPISSEKVFVNIPRITALLVLGLLTTYLLSNQLMVLVLLVIDFFIRGFAKTKYSPIAFLSKKIHGQLSWGNERLINKAPKIFAARLGFVFTFIILALSVFGFENLSYLFSAILILFAGLECVVNFCVGCWVFTLFVNPFYSKN